MFCIMSITLLRFFFFSSRRRHTRLRRDWSSDVCSSDLAVAEDDGEIMGVSHKEYLIEGVQFHPESIMTDEGKKILENFIMRVKND